MARGFQQLASTCARRAQFAHILATQFKTLWGKMIVRSDLHFVEAYSGVHSRTAGCNKVAAPEIDVIPFGLCRPAPGQREFRAEADRASYRVSCGAEATQ